MRPPWESLDPCIGARGIVDPIGGRPCSSGSLARCPLSATAVCVALGPPKQRALLAILLTRIGEVVPLERLIEGLWGTAAPRTADHSIQIYVSDLRRAFEPLGGSDRLVTRQPGYVVEVDPDSVDAWMFERLVKEGTRLLEDGDQDAGRSTIREALGLWSGRPLSELSVRGVCPARCPAADRGTPDRRGGVRGGESRCRKDHGSTGPADGCRTGRSPRGTSTGAADACALPIRPSRGCPAVVPRSADTAH